MKPLSLMARAVLVAAAPRAATMLLPIAAPATAAPMTYIHEYPHPRVVEHYHPRAGQQLYLRDARYALEQGCHAIELDLHLRDGEVVCNHDGPTVSSPRLADVLRLIVRYQNSAPTVQRDGLQFFVVLEPKANDPILFDAIVDVLQGFAGYFSTGARPETGPRGITVVFTGSWLDELEARFQRRRGLLDRLCILENRGYEDRIISLAPKQPRFAWTALRYPVTVERVAGLQAGTDSSLKGRYNVRIWGGAGRFAEMLATGADSINVDHEQVPEFVALAHPINRAARLQDRPPRFSW